MLTFRNTNIFFGIIIVCLLLLQVWVTIPLIVYIGMIAVYFVFLIYGSCSVRSNFFMKVLCEAKTTEKIIAISFDDGPVPLYTPHILKVLKEHGVPAAFFCIGRRIVQNESLIREVHDQGHIIGNHSYSHTPLFDMLPSNRMLQDVRLADMALSQSLGLKPKLFRPPYGITTPAMKKVMAKGDYTAIGWDVRSFDTMATNENRFLDKLMKLLHPGAVILLHDTQKITLSVLPRFILAARNEGYEFVRLDKLLKVKVYE